MNRFKVFIIKYNLNIVNRLKSYKKYSKENKTFRELLFEDIITSTIFFAFILLGIILLFISKYFNVTITTNDSTLHYLLSTIIQSNAAILSLMVVVIIFRIQYLDQSIDKVRNEVRFEFSTEGWWSKLQKFENLSLTQKMSYINQDINEKEKNILSKWIKIEDKKLLTKLVFVYQISLSLITFFFFIILLPLSVTIHQSPKFEQVVIIFIVTIQLSFISLMFRSIYKMFETD